MYGRRKRCTSENTHVTSAVRGNEFYLKIRTQHECDASEYCIMSHLVHASLKKMHYKPSTVITRCATGPSRLSFTRQLQTFSWIEISIRIQPSMHRGALEWMKCRTPQSVNPCHNRKEAVIAHCYLYFCNASFTEELMPWVQNMLTLMDPGCCCENRNKDTHTRTHTHTHSIKAGNCGIFIPGPYICKGVALTSNLCPAKSWDYLSKRLRSPWKGKILDKQ